MLRASRMSRPADRSREETAWPGRSKVRTSRRARARWCVRAPRRSRSAPTTTAASVTLVFHVTDGDVEGTDVSGLTVAAVADTPKVMSEGNWRLGVFIDDDASDEQAEKLGAVFGGQLGGPMQALGPLVGENLGVERAPIEVREEGLRHSVKIGDAVDFEIEDVVPFGVESGEPARLDGHLPSGGFRADDRQGDALAASVRSASSTRASPGSPPRTSPGQPDVNAARLAGRPRRAWPRAGVRRRPRAPRADRAALRARRRRLVVDGRPDGRDGRGPGNRRSGRWAGSSASGS